MSGDMPLFITGKCTKAKHWQCHSLECNCTCHEPAPPKPADPIKKFQTAGQTIFALAVAQQIAKTRASK